jgi:nucleotide-binding universal stress UspA family protein
MCYKTILVSLNEIDRLDPLLEVVTGLAAGEDAHVIGLYVIPAPAVFPATGPYALPEVFDSFSKYFEEQRPVAKAKFETAMARSGVPWQWMETRAAVPGISDAVSAEGRIADLVVLSEVDRGADRGVELDLIENVVLSVGRPVLVLPRQVPKALDLTQIVCGYNGSREAARALHDALPLLKRARDVNLVWVDPSLDRELARAVPGADMAESLDRHGIKVTAEAMPTNGINPAQALLTRAADLGAGIIVMGAYGHSRLREFVLGGATREALSNLSIPVVLSH